ncbi:exodeoxyribonuclease V subunit gamma [Phytoactinopolyspora alkaliphila]|uniref:RecBCD enzyme subunit RecC n=1 Tax=Phytoactinopolyspora alkaliphila TaxID=1783498 RepID=A0A6N9YQF7_9ACTN|nr:exodeoxyribonuclease V subunit gamma [Phytoactinopolyspora alkaliphila]NED97059.1 exodeoxyribonuclease V subunit gamma [Phytoactinopolyspora alkaliphila]
MTLHIHRAERTDVLADGLGELLATRLADPFAEELVVVPAKGVERWLSQRLSHRLGTAPGRGDGVCAGIRFTSPRSLTAALLGLDDEDPWAAEAMAWPLLAALDESLDELWCKPVAQHLGHFNHGVEAELRRGRRYAVAARLARLFAAYSVQRPRILKDWSAGRDTDGRGDAIDHDLAWQPELWRGMVEQIGAPPPHVRHADTLALLRQQPESFDLPDRLSLFGHTRLPITEVELISALAEHRDVHLWLPHPSAALWDRLADVASTAADRIADTSYQEARHPLLATLGRDSRELRLTLAAVPAVDTHIAMPAAPDTLLGWLQSDIRGNTQAPAGRRLPDGDRSVQVHACHGPARQVDVLREVLLGMLAADPTLEPRDIIVMCPDIETYAPLITAGFGLGDLGEDGHPAHRLRVRLADRSLTQTNPLLSVAAQLLDLAGGRATASQVLDLAQAKPVRRRFGFTDDDLATITAWVRESGARWAFDQDHREAFGLAAYLQNTWRFGLDRVLGGVAMSADARAWIGTALPLDDVGSARIELAGRFAEYLDRLRMVGDSLDGTRPLSEWVDALRAGVEQLTQVGRDEAWQVGEVRREFAGVAADAGTLATTPLRLPDVRALLSARLAGRPTRANFRTGTLTVCTMVPMRSVPHRVVCLLGLDDGVFPRFGLADGDDVLARCPVTGERDVRAEDRQLMLDAILAATEALVITYTGANEYTGQPRPPAVPVGELLDALDHTTEIPVRDTVLVKHPLQPFDRKNLEPGRLGTPGPFTFDPASLVAARSASGSRPARPEFLPGPLPSPRNDDVTVAELLAFFRDPVKGFFRALDVTLPWEVEGVSDAMPVEIDNLEKWSAGDRMLVDMLTGVPPDQALHAEWRRGTLPPGRLGWRSGMEIRDNARKLAIAALTHRQAPSDTYNVDVDLGGGRLLTGTVSSVYARRLISVSYSRLGAKHLLASWVQLLALSATDEDHNWTGLVIGRRQRGNEPATRLFGPVGADARELLADLVAIYDAGRREPLPLPLKTSFAWYEARRTKGDPVMAARRRWKPASYEGENADPAHMRVWGANTALEVLLKPASADEMRPGETTRLGAYAARVWGPMLDHEREAP